MKKLFDETWKPIKGYEGLYEVSTLGNVRSVDRYVMNGNRCCLLKGKPRKPYFISTGYLMADLFKNGQGKKYLIHRLVAEAFTPNPKNLPCIDHINTIKTDNRVENLKWCSYKENSNNPLTREHNKNRPKEVYEKILATKRKKQSCHCEIPVYYIDEQGKKISFKSMSEAQRQTNVHHFSISLSIKKKRPISGRQWYKEEIATAN